MTTHTSYNTGSLLAVLETSDGEAYEIGWDYLWMSNDLDDEETGERMPLLGFESDEGDYAPEEIMFVMVSEWGDLSEAEFHEALKRSEEDDLEIVGWKVFAP